MWRPVYAMQNTKYLQWWWWWLNNFLASSSPLLSTMLNRKCLQSHISYLFFGHIETSFKVPIAVRLFNNFSAHMVEASVETEIFWFTKYLTVLFNSWEQIFSCQWLFPFFCYIYIFYFICYYTYAATQKSSRLCPEMIANVFQWTKSWRPHISYSSIHFHAWISGQKPKPNQKPQNQTEFLFFWKIILPFPARQ